MQPRIPYLYTAWFLDEEAELVDQDRESPACFVIEASSAVDAQQWGDHLSRAFAVRNASAKFTSSSVEVANVADPAVSALPRVPVGVKVPDTHIGW
jgi:hypothetical protein